MYWWCGDPDCEDGEKCRNARTRNSLLNSNTFRGAVRRIERATDRKVAYSPGTPWDGRRPAFAPGVRESVMGGSGGTGGVTCQLCNTAINDTCGHADHKIPWREYTMQSATPCPACRRAAPAGSARRRRSRRPNARKRPKSSAGCNSGGKGRNGPRGGTAAGTDGRAAPAPIVKRIGKGPGFGQKAD